MKITSFPSLPIRALGRSILLAFCAASAGLSAGELPALVDDFAHAGRTSLATPRLTLDDAGLGGRSSFTETLEDGVLRMEGQIAPGRGQPGFVSLVLLLSPQGEPQDLSQYEGIRLRVRVTKGNLSVLAASAEIENFDFHSAVIPRTRDGAFQELRVPFADLKRLWSEQIPLDLATIASVNLVVSGIQPGAFAYEVDEIGFY